MLKLAPRSIWSGFAATTAALTLAAPFNGAGVVAVAAPAAPLPPGVTACDFPALANDPTPQGLNIRAAPNTSAAVLGRLRMIPSTLNPDPIRADLHVIGVSHGWFLIENAHYSDDDLEPPIPTTYRGRGWVSGKLLTTSVQGFLKAAPEESAADLTDDDNNQVNDMAAAILDCKGQWLRVQSPFVASPDRPGIPADAPRGTVRGWSDKSCTNQRTTCDFG